MPPKIRFLRKQTPPQVPTEITKPKDDLSSLLESIVLPNQGKLSPGQIKILLNLRFTNGTKILSRDRPQGMIDIINLLYRLPFDQVIQYLQTTSNLKEAILNSSLLNDERERVNLEIDNLQSEIEAEEGIHQCDRCGGSRTIGFQKQVRSADEPMTTFIRCLGCGARWRVD